MRVVINEIYLGGFHHREWLPLAAGISPIFFQAFRIDLFQ